MTQVARHTALALIGSVLALLGCQEHEHRSDPLELRVLVASERVAVYATQRGDCGRVGTFRDEVGCRQVDWRLAPVDGCLASTCVSEFRLERSGVVLARSSDSSTFAALELSTPLETGTSLVLEGCHGTLGFALPPARAGGSLGISTAGGQIVVDADSEAAGVFALAVTVPNFLGTQGYAADCHRSGPQATLSTSDQAGFYAVEAFALGEPVSSTQSFVHAQMWPATYQEASVSTSVDLGLGWQVAVEAARLSPLYAPCTNYCAAWNAACAQPTSDTTDCAATCTIAGEPFPQCRDEYQALVTCLAAAPVCTPQREATTPEACSAADAAWQGCAKQ